MGKIRVMDKQLSELIAAGEVVERPASVVKELVENALDAGATGITVEIERGGVLLIRVTDNGSGIAREDVRTAFLRHATSKIRQQSDLDGIATLGFRGEALAAISAVSHIEVVTRTAEEEAGTLYTCDGGEEGEASDIGCAVGTAISVKELFYNTPARMKFLKKDVSEGNAVSALVERIALSHPEVSLRLIREGKTTLQTPGDNQLRSVIYTVLGRAFSEGLLPVDREQNGIRVTGYISKPAAGRPNRNMQYFFINGRYVKSRTVMAALEQAYRNAVMVGKFPAGVLHLTIPYGAVDVNVHPAKTEVRFSDEKRIFDAVYYAVKNALFSTAEEAARPAARPFPGFSGEEKPTQATIRQFWQTTAPKSSPGASSGLSAAAPAAKPAANLTADPTAAPAVLTPAARPESVSPSIPDGEIRFADSGIRLYSPGGRPVNLDIMVDDRPMSAPVNSIVEQEAAAEKTASPDPAGAAPSPAQEREASPPSDVAAAETAEAEAHLPLRVIGEVFSTYILIEQGEELILLDKHAAHERLIYDNLCKSEAPRQQLLLTPVPVTLPREEYDAILQNLDLLEKSGYAVEEFGGSVLVRAIPAYLEGEDIPTLISEAADGFLQHKRDAVGAKMTWLYESVACRAAIKAGDRLSLPEMTALAERILYGGDVATCPHGRPVVLRMGKKELEKKFGRIQ